MSGYLRQGRPSAGKPVAVVSFICEREIALALREADPFLITDRCQENPIGHHPIRSAGDTVCAFCSKVFWRPL